ncbi:hypothetical protein ZHAS_00019370 [Anopheles sinensis]|uniref:LisH domain-containing protein n=1 Tax=Anopheles sinensis TaxID=74873 RepID=A0A084WM73_ANOSI|nr:hypothetical protein ZHAS_00019370 [Anopheles sinensis]
MAQEGVNVRTLTLIFEEWEESHLTPGYNPAPTVKHLAEMFETETKAYKMKDPDPFDERHPSRTDPNCELGRMLKALFRKDSFMTRLVNDYMLDNFFTRQRIQQSSFELNVAASRLILVIMPGLDTAAVFQHDNNSHNQLIRRLYKWAETSEEPLKSYATGLLGAAMEVQDIAFSFREQNVRLMPIMLNRLRVLHHEFKNRGQRPVWMPPQVTEPVVTAVPPEQEEKPEAAPKQEDEAMSSAMDLSVGIKENETVPVTEESNRIETEPMEDDTADPEELENKPESSKSEGAQSGVDKPKVDQPAAIAEPEVAQPERAPPLVEPRRSAQPRLMIPIHPVTSETSQMLILGYLTPMGEYQEFLPHIFEHNVMQLIFSYIEDVDSKDTCLAFEALKYLASLLCHKKFSIEFISNGGLERLLKIPRPSLAATGVSVAFYYLAYCEDAMERICLMPREIITEMVAYALWLLACPHDSGRCHATMFFGLSCQFKTILDEFDKQDGLRKLYNVISVLPILSNSDEFEINDDEEASERQVVRHVCVALKKYFENHLYYKYLQVTRQQQPAVGPAVPVFKAAKSTQEVISHQITALQELLPMKAHWAPVDELLKLGGINLLLRVVYITYEWNYNGRGDTVRFALDVLNVCCVLPRVHHTFTERVKFPDGASAAGVNIVLGAAEGEIVADAEVQKSALAVLVHLVCAPIHRPSGSLARYGSAKKRMPNKSSEELIQKVWESVRSNNGIIVLLQLMCVKTPITDADCIRGMACRALAGLARSDTVRQIVGKLPLFVHGQLQSLMRDPILQEKRVEHVLFQKYALELMERVSGKADSFNNQLDTSLADIHKANVVAQTRIQFNEQQLYQLIYQHLASRGLTETASQLLKETGLSASLMQPNALHHQNHQGGSSLTRSAVALHSPFVFRSPNTTIVQRSRIRSRTVDPSFNVSTAQANLQAALAATSIDTPSQTVPLANGTAAGGSETDSAASSVVNSATEIPPAAIEASPAELPPIKLIKKSAPSSMAVTGNGLTATPYSSSNAKALPAEPTPPPNNITLHTIVTEYLTNQHALCKNPMSTCPPFDLFQPHKCPDPRPHRSSGISNNFAARFYRRQTGYASRRFDRRLVHSTFHSSRVIRPQEIDYCFTTCDFTPCGTKLIVGSQAGEVWIYNLNDPMPETTYSCHESAITSIKCSKDGKLLLTTGAWRFPMSALWNIEGNQFTQKLHWEEEDYLEFANLTPDKVLATINEVATIYDINTGQKVMKFEPVNCNQYAKNRATFCPTDELILSDGVLWDATSGKEIHKFDKLNQTISGVFHPNGLEIVSNTEVWDLRTFHLLRTVLPLEQSHVKFSPQNVLYGIRLETNSTEDMETCTYETSFKVLDSYDYSSIATIDVKRNIYDLAINAYGSQIAVVENPGSFNNTVQESTVRIYSVGRKRPIEDEQDDEEEEMNSDENSMSETESVGKWSRKRHHYAIGL